MTEARKQLTTADFEWAASRLGCTVAQIRAVDQVESLGGGFIPGTDKPKILFERHIFSRETGGRFDKTHPGISGKRGGYLGGLQEWGRLEQAKRLNARAALRSASVGRYQIMGFNHKLAGFETVEAFWEACGQGERPQLEAFVAFIRNSGLAGALRKISNVHADCVPFAKGYNGSAYAEGEYHVKLARAHKKFAG